MIARKKKEEERAPTWMLTLGDITMLLLTFFVLLVSMMQMEKPRYILLQGFLQGLRAVTAIEEPQGHPREVHNVVLQIDQAAQEGPGTVRPLVQAQDRYAEVRVEGDPQHRYLVVTLGGDGTFAQGDYRLAQTVYPILDAIKRWRGAGGELIIRGHTDAHPHDSVVMDAGGRIVPFTEHRRSSAAPKTAPEPADYLLLATLRAQEVFQYLALRARPSDPFIPAERMRTEAVGPYDPLKVGPGPLGHQPLNQRVEIVFRATRR